MAELVEKVALPFDDGGEQDAGSAPTTNGALALSSADTAKANADYTVARVADYAHS